MVAPLIEVVVLDFDETCFSLRADWPSLKNGSKTREQVEGEAIRGRRMQQHVNECLDYLSDRYHLAIYSRNLTATIETVLKASLVDGIYVLGQDSGWLKPDPGGLEEIARYYSSDKLIMVGDGHYDQEVAEAYGCPYIKVPAGQLLSDRLFVGL